MTKRDGLRKWKTWKQQVHQVMWLSIIIGLLTGIGLTAAVISLTQSWFGWGW